MYRRGRWCSRCGAIAVVAAVLITLPTACTSKLTDTAHVTLDGHDLTVEVADSMEEQTRGLTGRREPNDHEGMLFVWDEAAPRAFVISSVTYDLDVIFIGADKRVNEVLPLSPDDEERAQGAYPSRWVIEVRGGWAERYGIEPGSEFEIVGSGD